MDDTRIEEARDALVRALKAGGSARLTSDGMLLIYKWPADCCGAAITHQEELVAIIRKYFEDAPITVSAYPDGQVFIRRSGSPVKRDFATN